MSEPFHQQIIKKIEQASGLYNRLVLVVAPSGSGKTSVMHETQKHLGVPFVNVNLEISRRMLDLTARQRALEVPHLLEEIVRDTQSEVVLLDNCEILFEVSLKQDPMRLLQGLSRNRTLVISWSGEIKNKLLVYASPGHPEYCRYPANELMVVELSPGEET